MRARTTESNICDPCAWRAALGRSNKHITQHGARRMAKDVIQLLGCVEAARRLGVCVATVKALADAGEIPVLRDSARRRLFFASDVEAFAKQRRRQRGARGQ